MPPNFGKALGMAPPCWAPGLGDPVASLASWPYRSPTQGEGGSWRRSHPPVPAAAAAPWPLPSLGGPSPEVLSPQGLRSVPATRQCLPWGTLVGGNGA